MATIYLDTNDSSIIYVKNLSDVTPENAKQWIKDDITTIIIDADDTKLIRIKKDVKPFILTAPEMVADYSFLIDYKEKIQRKQDHRYTQQRHSFNANKYKNRH